MEIKKFKFVNKSLILLKMYIILSTLVVGVNALDYNLVELFSKGLNSTLKTNYPINKLIYIIIAGCGLIFALDINTWFPILDKSFLPNDLIPIKIPLKYNKLVTINTKPNVKVAYWTTLKNNSSYDDFSNNGVVMSNANGVAELPVIEGPNYTLPLGIDIQKRVFYRILNKRNGILGKVKSKKY